MCPRPFVSNLALRPAGPNAVVEAYTEDFGDNNAAVGHRRWVLYWRLGEVGLGDIPGVANALDVIGAAPFYGQPPTQERYITVVVIAARGCG